MGSKSKLLDQIWAIAAQFNFETVIDLFSGSGIVSYMFKSQGRTVISNDYMAMSATFAKAMVENNSATLSLKEAKELLMPAESDHFVENTFS
jgi:DNA adenine methylase